MHHCASASAVIRNNEAISVAYRAAYDALTARLTANQITEESDLRFFLEWVLELDTQFNFEGVIYALGLNEEQLRGAAFHDVMHFAVASGVAVLPSMRTQDLMEQAGNYAKTKNWVELGSTLLDKVKTLRSMVQRAMPVNPNNHVH